MIRTLALRAWWQRLFLRAAGQLWDEQSPLSSPSRDRPHTTTGVVSNPRAEAYAELRAAEDARDSRRIGKARMILAQETHNQLAREVWG